MNTKGTEAHLRVGATRVTDVVDMETGEVVDTRINKIKYLVPDKEGFWLMYSSMVMFLKQSDDVRVSLFASLMERYSQGQEFSMTKPFKQVIAKELGWSARSFDNAVTFLVERKMIVRLNGSLYKINPRHIFRGGDKVRNGNLKAILEVECPDC